MSSHSIFNNVFSAGSRAGGQIVPAGCGPLDMIRSKVRELLAADATVMAIAGDIIQAFDFLPRHEDLSGRKLMVYALPLLAEFRPIQVEANEVEIQIGLCWRTQNTLAVPDYAPTYLTALDHVKTVLRADHHLSDTVNGVGVQLAKSSRPGTQAVAVLSQDDRGGTQFFAEMGWVYAYDVDNASGQIKSVTEAGA